MPIWGSENRINAMAEFKLSFVEYGKYFEPDRTSDFFDLAYTEDLAGRSKQFRDVLNMPDSQRTPFQYVNGEKRVSAAFLPYENGWFFAHIQARREDEKYPVSMNRPFYQIRFVPLDSSKLAEVFSTEDYGFFSFLHIDRSMKNTVYALRDYVEIEGSRDAIIIDERYNTTLQPKLIKDYDNNLVSNIVNALSELLEKERNGYEVQIRIIYNEEYESLEKRLLLMDVVQQMIYPKYGWVSFALDYVSSNVSPPRVQFLSRKDANNVKYSEFVKPENRQEINIVDIKEDMNFTDNDYVRAVKTFIKIEVNNGFPVYEDLFSDRLRELIKKYDISGFDLFLVLHRNKINPDPFYWLFVKKNDFDYILEEMSEPSIRGLYKVLHNISHPRVYQIIIQMVRKQMPDAGKAFHDTLVKYSETPLLYAE